MKDKCNILVTRPKHQADNLCRMMTEQGWNAVRFPTLNIVAIDNDLIKQQLNRIEQYQWLIFISINAVNFALKANNGKIDRFLGKPIAAVGKATEKALLAAGLSVALVPKGSFNTEGLLATEKMQDVKGKSCLIIRGQGGRETLADQLGKRGATVEYMEVYARETPIVKNENVNNILIQGELDVITVTSGDALKNLMEMIDQTLHDKLQAVPLIVISDRLKMLAEKYRFKHIVVTDNPGDTAMIEKIKMSQRTQ